MNVRCDKCSLLYDDADRYTICPHYVIGAEPPLYCREHDLYGCHMHDNRVIKIVADRFEQPDPVKGQQKVHPIAVQSFNELMQQRYEKGLERYGTELETFNGRDAWKDFEEEFGDAWKYYTAAKMESAEKIRRLEDKICQLGVTIEKQRQDVSIGENAIRLSKRLHERIDALQDRITKNCKTCCGQGQILDMNTASIRTDTLPPKIECPDCVGGFT